MSLRKLTAVLHREDGLWVADCPEVGTVSQGETPEAAVANLKEATELFLEEFPRPELGSAVITSFDAEVA